MPIVSMFFIVSIRVSLIISGPKIKKPLLSL
jgi:hypothetical protein